MQIPPFTYPADTMPTSPLRYNVSVKTESTDGDDTADEGEYPENEHEPNDNEVGSVIVAMGDPEPDVTLVASDLVPPSAPRRRSTAVTTTATATTTTTPSSGGARRYLRPTEMAPRCEICKKQKRKVCILFIYTYGSTSRLANNDWSPASAPAPFQCRFLINPSSGKCDKCYKQGYECSIVEMVQVRAFVPRSNAAATSRRGCEVLKCDVCHRLKKTVSIILILMLVLTDELLGRGGEGRRGEHHPASLA